MRPESLPLQDDPPPVNRRERIKQKTSKQTSTSPYQFHLIWTHSRTTTWGTPNKGLPLKDIGRHRPITLPYRTQCITATRHHQDSMSPTSIQRPSRITRGQGWSSMDTQRFHTPPTPTRSGLQCRLGPWHPPPTTPLPEVTLLLGVPLSILNDRQRGRDVGDEDR